MKQFSKHTQKGKFAKANNQNIEISSSIFSKLEAKLRGWIFWRKLTSGNYLINSHLEKINQSIQKSL